MCLQEVMIEGKNIVAAFSQAPQAVVPRDAGVVVVDASASYDPSDPSNQRIGPMRCWPELPITLFKSIKM